MNLKYHLTILSSFHCTLILNLHFSQENERRPLQLFISRNYVSLELTVKPVHAYQQKATNAHNAYTMVMLLSNSTHRIIKFSEPISIPTCSIRDERQTWKLSITKLPSLSHTHGVRERAAVPSLLIQCQHVGLISFVLISMPFPSVRFGAAAGRPQGDPHGRRMESKKKTLMF